MKVVRKLSFFICKIHQMFVILLPYTKTHVSIDTRCHAHVMPRACSMLVHFHGFMEKIKKIIWRKTVDPQCFQGKNYKTKVLTSSIWKKKSTKTILKKNHKKTIWRNTVAIHNILKKKTTKQNSQPVQYEKNKINKDHFGKKRRKKS